MLGTRILVSLVGIPILLGVSFLGGWWLTLLVAILVCIGLLEFYQLAARQKLKPVVPAGVLGGLALVLTAYINIGGVTWLGTVITIGILLVFLACFPRLGLADTAITLLGIWYVGSLMAYLPLIRLLPNGAGALVITFLLTWANDSGAYFCGRMFGRKHPWPRLSPGKTRAGVIGGVLGTVAVAVILGPVFLPPLSRWLLVGLAIIAAIAAQIGDLIESGLKRQAGVKDSGCFLPGHGGILDRFDSLLLVAPVIYYYLAFFLVK